jgi:hypothetical protein
MSIKPVLSNGAAYNDEQQKAIKAIREIFIDLIICSSYQ